MAKLGVTIKVERRWWVNPLLVLYAMWTMCCGRLILRGRSHDAVVAAASERFTAFVERHGGLKIKVDGRVI